MKRLSVYSLSFLGLVFPLRCVAVPDKVESECVPDAPHFPEILQRLQRPPRLLGERVRGYSAGKGKGVKEGEMLEGCYSLDDAP